MMNMENMLEKKARNRRRRRVAVLVVALLFAGATLWAVLGGPGMGDKALSAGKTVTITITCQELADNMDSLQDKGLAGYVPKGGEILAEEACTLSGEATVYDALKKVCRDHHIPYIQKTGSGYSGVYITSINHLAEFDGGPRSGWMYQVNGKSPNLSCSRYKVKNGDKIKWFYTIDYNKE